MPDSVTARVFAKVLALAALLLVLSGFDYEAQPQNPAPQRETAVGQSAAELEPAPSFLPQELSWRVAREKAPPPAAAADLPGSAETGNPWTRVHSWETGANKSREIAALEVLGFLAGLNIFDRIVYHDDFTDGKRTYDSDFSSTWHHLSRQDWGYDKDPFNVNQFAHPYQGATMYGLARSCGLGFWESWAYSNVGSFLWKMAGETDRPSINDMVTTGNSGSLLGEALFRMSALLLRQEHPDAWHEVAAAVVSPPTGFNRLAFGDRFKEAFPSHDPATFWRFRFGLSLNNHQQDGTVDFAMSYGLPGKPGYSYDRPLDYFDFQISALGRGSNPIGNVLLRGLLYGKRYDAGDDYRGIWGLYGSYDYISPNVFRVSTTALSLGTTGQYWLAPMLALQGSVLGGVGFGGAGETPTSDGNRDYHYGVTPQGMLALRLMFDDMVAVESVLRGYYVSGTGSDNARGNESIMRSNTNLIFRIFRRHGIGVQLVESVREAKYASLPAKHESDTTVSLFYTFLGDTDFGAVEWRER